MGASSVRSMLRPVSKQYILPKLGQRPIADITAPEVLAMLRVIEAKGALETARRVMQITGQIFMYAIATGRAERNPVPDLRGALKAPVVKHHRFLKASELPLYLKKLEAYDGSLQTKLALRLLLLTFVRTDRIARAQWTEIDWDKAEWRIPAERMKMKELHIVPLSRQAIAVLRELEKHSGNRQYVFPNQHNPSHVYEREHDALCSVSHGLSFTHYWAWISQHRQHDFERARFSCGCD